jgi:Uma2 family endonuclease
MSSAPQTAATPDDLHRVEGRAELIGGRIVRFPTRCVRSGRVIGRTCRSLGDYAERLGRGDAYTGTMGFVVPELASGRRSFSPDAAYYLGPLPADDMDFIEGPPTFAVEVRSKGDYGPAAEADLAAKRADYFEAGTLMVWDVDPRAERVRAYRAETPDRAVVWGPGDVADAEPAVPGWRVAVDDLLG